MDPGVVPIELSRLTNLEQILIARAHPMMSVYCVKGQQYKYSSNVSNFAEDVNSIANVLPFKPADLSGILIVNRTGANAIKQFRVRHGIPEDMPHAREDNAQLSNENQSIDVVEDDIEGPPEIVNQNVHIDEFHAVGTIFIGPQPNQQASLFPYGNADFRQARPRKVNPSEYFQYLMKYFDGRFAKDSRFRYFAWNSISRWRALSLGDVYVKKNPLDAELSIQDIQNMVASGDKRLAGCISYYAKSIRGTRAYCGHVHGFLWFKDAPDVNRLTRTEEDKNRIIEYFDRLVSTENPDVGMSIPMHEHPCARILDEETNLDLDDNDYASLVNWVMRHSKCGTYCLRLHKTTNQMVCRFRYPFDVLRHSSIVEEPPNSNMFRFLGHRNDPLVCSHNRKVLQTWRANIDWSPVLSVQSVIHYIAKYAAKAEPASKTFTDTLRQIVDDLRRPCPTARSAIKRLLVKSVSERDISAQEVCYLLMGYPLTNSSRKCVLLNVSETSILSLSLRRSHDTDGEDVVGTDPSFVIFYMTRPFEYENFTLLQMAKKHYFSKKRWHKSKVESIVCIIPELDGTELLENSENWELYCRQQVLLHHHYHSLAKAIGECETWTLRYVDLGLALNDCVNITDLVDEEYEEIEDIELQSEGVRGSS
ncbi:Uncharacterized protein Adt_23345 [Abeliophyllum distichum]|uniref:DUF6570 domain-containing protein n=1 Tax=Abeliophyllum distichum TaxID=126358 RepID=A0ABD1SAU8_9LAMI